jgi:hypothetical protein
VIYRRHTGSAPLGALQSTYDKEPLDTTVGQALFFLLTTVNHIRVNPNDAVVIDDGVIKVAVGD